MRKRVIFFLVAAIFLSSLIGCANTSKTKLVASYENMGKSLKLTYDRGQQLCEVEKVLGVEDCARLKKIYNDTRKVYFVTGDTLAFVVEIDDKTFNNAASTEYAKLSAEFTNLILQWLRLASELGLIKEEKK